MTPAIKAAEQAKLAFSIHRYEHDPNQPAYGEEAARALGLPMEQVFRTLVVELGGGMLAVAIVPVARKLSLKDCAHNLRAKRAAMAERSAAERATGYVVGGISPLGQKKQLPTVLDESATRFDSIFVSAGRRGLEMELAPNDLAHLTHATIAQVATR